MKAVKRFVSSSSFFMASLCSLFLLIVIGLLIFFIIVIGDEALLNESESAIDADIRAFQEADSIHGIAYIKKILQKRLEDPDNTSIYALQNPDEKLVLSNIPQWPGKIVKVPEEGIIQFEVLPKKAISRSSQTQYHASWQRQGSFDVMAKLYEFESGYIILVGRNIEDIKMAQSIASSLGWIVVVIVVLLSIGFFFIGYFVVFKVNGIAQIASDIMRTGDMSKRIPRESRWDDLSKLEDVLNQMLVKIEVLMLDTKRVTDNIAHDLRTPLTRLRTDIESIRDSEIRQSLLQETDTLLSMFNGLLNIAEIETKHKRSSFRKLALHELVEDAEALYQPLAQEKNISIDSHIDSCWLYGDRNLLFQTFVNIIDNAIKFTPPNQSIGIALNDRESRIEFLVADAGIGISTDEREKIFQRLYRSEESRNLPGHGLGLSIVNAVVELHKGSIFVEEQSPGVKFVLTFPVTGYA